MSSSLTPEPASVTGSSPEPTSISERSNVSLNFFKSLSEKRLNRDGTNSKRRGPKPDTKPALTRRQELNRQAQRTHRERKELYVKALEDEILRLKESYTQVSQDKERLLEENKALRNALTAAGIQHPGVAFSEKLYGSPGFASQSSNLSGDSPSVGGQLSDGGFSTTPMPMANQRDNEQAGIDFVLMLERPCMAHMGIVNSLADQVEDFPCGHALMATCPPRGLPAPIADHLFGSNSANDEGSDLQTWQLSKSGLARLLNLSAKLDLGGQVTPVMAWGMISSHERFHELTAAELVRLSETLMSKTRCYGFGAVMEHFEVRDAIQNTLSSLEVLVSERVWS